MADTKNNVIRLAERIGTSLLQRAGLAYRAGLQFGGKRKLYEVYGYNKDPRWDDFWARYQRQDVASRVIDAPVDSTWSPRPQFKNATFFNNTFQKLDQDLNLWEVIARADKLAGIGRYSVLYLGLDDSTDPARPVTSKKCNLMFLRAFSEASAVPRTFEQDVTNPRFGLPTMYEIDVGGMDANQQRTTVTGGKRQVHWSRVLHIVEQPMESLVYGTPRMLNVFNLLDDLAKVVGGSAEVYWLTSNRGMQVDVDKDMQLSPEEADELQVEVQEFHHELRRFMRTRGVKITTFDAQYPNPTSTFNMLISLLSGTTGIPQRILLGAEAGHLASDQDRANWADRIDDRRLKYAGPMILTPFMKLGVAYGFLKNSPDLSIEWGSAYRLSPKELAEQAAQWARAVANLSSQPKNGMSITSREEARKMIGLPEELPAGQEFIDAPLPDPNAGAGFGGSSDGSQPTPPTSKGTGKGGARGSRTPKPAKASTPSA